MVSNMTTSLLVQFQCRYVAIEGLYPNLSVASRIHQKSPKYDRNIDDTSYESPGGRIWGMI